MKSKLLAMLIVNVAIACCLPGLARARVHTSGWDAQNPVGSAAASKVPNKLALLVAINNYRNSELISPLSGSINDIEDMRQVLIGKFDFPPENIVVLKDAQATHAGIMQAIQTHLIAKARPGDIVVFEFSGHGSQMRDVTGKKASGLDETIVPLRFP